MPYSLYYLFGHNRAGSKIARTMAFILQPKKDGFKLYEVCLHTIKNSARKLNTSLETTTMKTIQISLWSLGLLLAVTACKQNKEEHIDVIEPTTPIEATTDTLNPVEKEVFKPQTVADELAVKIKDFINSRFLKPNDLQAINVDEKKFQLFQVDLNKDGKNEVFVYLNSPYFCGSGGCTVLLLSDKLELITKFTVTRPPLFVEPTEKNGWNVLSVQSGNEWKELVYNNGTYPANPSVVKKATYVAPDANALEIFGSTTPAKTYTF